LREQKHIALAWLYGTPGPIRRWKCKLLLEFRAENLQERVLQQGQTERDCPPAGCPRPNPPEGCVELGKLGSRAAPEEDRHTLLALADQQTREKHVRLIEKESFKKPLGFLSTNGR